MAREIPVYMIVGFLDSGKTQFINGVLEEGFSSGERTLLLSCEEGEEAYNKRALDGVTVIEADDMDALTIPYFQSLEKKYKPTQILVEFNGMWSMEEFCTKHLPGNWILYQIMCMVDANTFDVYAKNMGQMMMEKIRTADMIVFNRCTPELKASLRKRNLRMVNRRADIFLEDEGGGSEDYRDGTVSAFDLTQPVIEIADDDFGVFYVEVMDDLDMYLHKTVKFKGVVCQDKRFGDYFTVGRHAMVCCANDITYFGLPCSWEKKDTLKTRDWVEVTAKVRRCSWNLYEGGSGPLLLVEEVQPCEKPNPEVVQF